MGSKPEKAGEGPAPGIQRGSCVEPSHGSQTQPCPSVEGQGQPRKAPQAGREGTDRIPDVLPGPA